MSEIVSYMSSIPEENWDRINWNTLVDSSNGKTSVSKTEVPSSNLGQSADGGWINEQLNNQEQTDEPEGMTNEC